MSDSIGPPPPPVPVEAEAVAPPQGPNRLGVAALVVGIVALVLAFVPFASYGAGLPAIVALVLGIVAVARSGNRKRRAGIAGIVLGIVALIAAIVMSVIYTAVFVLAAVSNGTGGLPNIGSLSSAFPSGFPTSIPKVSSLASAPTSGAGGSVVFKVTGAGTADTIAYAAVDGAGAGTDDVTGVDLPWSKSVAVPSGSGEKVYTLVVQGDGDSPVTCTITLNGKVLSTNTSSGSDGVASCSAHQG